MSSQSKKTIYQWDLPVTNQSVPKSSFMDDYSRYSDEKDHKHENTKREKDTFNTIGMKKYSDLVKSGPRVGEMNVNIFHTYFGTSNALFVVGGGGQASIFKARAIKDDREFNIRVGDWVAFRVGSMDNSVMDYGILKDTIIDSNLCDHIIKFHRVYLVNVLRLKEWIHSTEHPDLYKYQIVNDPYYCLQIVQMDLASMDLERFDLIEKNVDKKPLMMFQNAYLDYIVGTYLGTHLNDRKYRNYGVIEVDYWCVYHFFFKSNGSNGNILAINLVIPPGDMLVRLDLEMDHGPRCEPHLWPFRNRKQDVYSMEIIASITKNDIFSCAFDPVNPVITISDTPAHLVQKYMITDQNMALPESGDKIRHFYSEPPGNKFGKIKASVNVRLKTSEDTKVLNIDDWYHKSLLVQLREVKEELKLTHDRLNEDKLESNQDQFTPSLGDMDDLKLSMSELSAKLEKFKAKFYK